MRSSAAVPSIDRIEEVLTDASLDDQVDMVITHPAPDVYRAAASTGSVTFRRDAEDGRYRYQVVATSGADPLADRSTDRFVGLDAELAHPFPTRDTTAYPHAFDQIAQFFDSVHAPELVVQHTAGHHFGGNIGQHGSLGIVQARAPFIASGAGVAALGTVQRSARMIDVAPSVLWAMGGAPHPDGVGPTGAPRHDALLRRQDGDPLVDVFEHGGARHVVIVLLDGCNANVLYDAIVQGGAPTIAALAAGGTTLGHGLFASLPTATLANHTTASTGAHPGHSGVLHNMWHDRDRGVTPDLLAMDQMFAAMVHLDPGVETMHQAVHRNRPDAVTGALFEFCDTGADVSSFADFRSGNAPRLPDATTLVDADQDLIGSSGAYSFISSVDELATRQAVSLWNREAGNALPDLTFLALSLTDESGHETGPYSDMGRAAIADSDRRVARLVDAVERSGALGATTFLVIADHGMERCDPDNDATWADALAAVGGDTVVDVADGLVYVSPAIAPAPRS